MPPCVRTVAESIGVTPHPEINMVELTPEHSFFVIATDGVWEFLSSQEVVDIVRPRPPLLPLTDLQDCAIGSERQRLIADRDPRRLHSLRMTHNNMLATLHNTSKQGQRECC